MKLARGMVGDGDRLDLDEAVTQLRQAAAAKKCWGCGCLHNSLDSIDNSVPADRRSGDLDAALRAARDRLVPVRYECLGCDVCYPPLAMNALNVDAEACPSESVEERAGWPPLPGAYTVLRYHAPVAVCTLTDEQLPREVARVAGQDVAVVGPMYTENLGIERVIQNVISNPNVRFLILCGPDSKQTIGHLPGQSMLALHRNGLDENGRIVGARGRRPVIRNLDRRAVEHFRRGVEVIDLIGVGDIPPVVHAVGTCAARNPGPAEPFAAGRAVPVIGGYVPRKMVSDPAGYFVVYVDRNRRRLVMEHYQNGGILDVVIEGTAAAEVYIPAVEKGLVTRLDHAAYLGKELARAEHSLRTAEEYVQDAAPEQPACTPSPGCGCGSSRGGQS